jgi:hypothetical protein
VASGQWSVKTGGAESFFSWANIVFCTIFVLGMFRIAPPVGFLDTCIYVYASYILNLAESVAQLQEKSFWIVVNSGAARG